MYCVSCRAFIGQGAGSKKGEGMKGMKQKEQKQVLADFSAAKFNTMVATCIGEEGLDIPTVSSLLKLLSLFNAFLFSEFWWQASRLRL